MKISSTFPLKRTEIQNTDGIRPGRGRHESDNAYIPNPKLDHQGHSSNNHVALQSNIGLHMSRIAQNNLRKEYRILYILAYSRSCTYLHIQPDQYNQKIVFGGN